MPMSHDRKQNLLPGGATISKNSPHISDWPLDHILMPDFSTIDNRYLDSWHILISCQLKHGYPLNIPCSKISNSCKIKRVVTNLTQLGYVNNYDKNRYLEIFSKAAVYGNYNLPLQPEF